MKDLINETLKPEFQFPVYKAAETPILFIRAIDDALIDVGVQPGDMLVIDQSKIPLSGDIILVEFNGRLLVNRLSFHFGKAYLIPENSKYKIICVNPNDDFVVKGVLVKSIRSQVISHIKPSHK